MSVKTHKEKVRKLLDSNRLYEAFIYLWGILPTSYKYYRIREKSEKEYTNGGGASVLAEQLKVLIVKNSPIQDRSKVEKYSQVMLTFPKVVF
mgnify:CR=1 FL=1